MKTIIVSISGGKDSTATALVALKESDDADVRFVFADTGNEHAMTLAYIYDYLPKHGIRAETVRADFTRRIAGKRAYIAAHWPAKGVPAEAIERALSVLQPTGNPFLDVCMLSGRFPARMAQFCTHRLKRDPIDAYMLERLAESDELESWQGVRRDESQARKDAAARERTPEGWTIVRPILEWTADQTVEHIRAAGLDLNPLYSLGMNRVGCMPCINVAKDELAEIALRFPEHIDKIREWERLVSLASKFGASSFFSDSIGEDETKAEVFARLNVDARVEWAKTSRGGKQYNFLKMIEPPACSSSYGLCE